MKNKLILLTFFTFTKLISQAQSFTDAIRFSQITTQGTARFNAMGGSMGALGADISTMALNPAGIGLNRKNEVQMGLGFFNNNVNATYKGTTTGDNSFNVNLPHLGMLLNLKKASETNMDDWRDISFGISYNRNNSFYRNISFTGLGTESIGDFFLTNAQGNLVKNLDPFTTDLAYLAYVIDSIPNSSNTYLKNTSNFGSNKNKSVEARGAQSDFNFSLGGNYKNKLYLGGTITLATINYTENNFYTENFQNTDSITLLSSIKFNEQLRTEGQGWNIKLGAIYRVTDYFRIGASVHTPTIYTLSDIYNSNINVTTNNRFDTIIRNFEYESPQGEFDYRLSTPIKGVFSIATIINKMASINLDYEILNYNQARYSSTDRSFNFTNTNQAIRNEGAVGQNIKLGAEIKLADFFIRGGYALYSEAYKQNLVLNKYRTSLSAGLGYRGKKFSLDVAYQLLNNKSRYFLFNTLGTNFADNAFASSTITTSISFRF